MNIQTRHSLETTGEPVQVTAVRVMVVIDLSSNPDKCPFSDPNGPTSDTVHVLAICSHIGGQYQSIINCQYLDNIRKFAADREDKRRLPVKTGACFDTMSLPSV